MAKTKNAKAAKSKQTSDEFISEDSISKGSASYMKLEKGSKFRIISHPINGWLEWVDKKPIRTVISEEPEATDDENPPKKFIAMAVIDRKDGLVKILELTQQSVIKAIRALANNSDWGAPFTYDINVDKSGEGLKTKYEVTPSPKKVLSKVEVAEAQDKPCNLEALFDGEDPWKEVEDVQTEYILK